MTPADRPPVTDEARADAERPGDTATPLETDTTKETP